MNSNSIKNKQNQYGLGLACVTTPIHMEKPMYFSLGTEKTVFDILLSFLFALSFAGLNGCASTRQVAFVNPVNTLSKQLSATSYAGTNFSSDTENALRSLGLEKEARRNPVAVLKKLVVEIERRPDLHWTFAAAELSLSEAQRLEFRDRDLAQEYYLSSLLYAYDFLFSPRFQKQRNTYDPRFRHACRSYNESLESILRIQGNRLEISLHPDTDYIIHRADGRDFRIRYHPSNAGADVADSEPFKFASDYSVKGLRQEFRQHGLGVPLLGKRRSSSKKTLETKYTPPTLTFPMTAILRIVPQGSVWCDDTPILSVANHFFKMGFEAGTVAFRELMKD